MLVAAYLRLVAGTKCGSCKYLDMSRLAELDAENSKLCGVNAGTDRANQERERKAATAPTL